MMFLTETNLLEVVKRQYFYKLKSNLGLFFSMVIVQIIAIVFSFNGIGSFGTGSGSISLSIRFYSGEIIFGFTALWAFIMAKSLTTETYRNYDYVFVSNRVSSNLANIVFLLTASIAGAVSVSLGGVLLRVIAYLFIGSQNISSDNFFVAPHELAVGIIVSTMYLYLCSAIGYFFGMLTQLYRAFIVILPTLFFGTLILEGRDHSEPATFIKLILFYGNESSFIFFAVKIIVTVAILLYGAISISNRLEVRRW